LSSRPPRRSANGPKAPGAELSDPGLARDRTALAWTRSALNMAASGTLIARAGFTAHLDALGVACAVGTAAMAWLTWRHGQVIYRQRGQAGAAPRLQITAFGLLTAASCVTAAVAIVVTIAI
jgi:uncharacterized membrane protein YidH (DUF202 family)